jgi:hypothetical protein
MNNTLTRFLWLVGLSMSMVACKDGMDPVDPDNRMPPHPMMGTYAGDCYLLDRFFNTSNGQWVELRDTFPGEVYVIDSIFNRGDTICSMHTSDFYQYFPLDCNRLMDDTIASSFYYSYTNVTHRWHRADSSLVYVATSQNVGGPGSRTLTCYYARVE